MIRDDPAAKAAAEQRIAGVPLPQQDPLYGDAGPCAAALDDIAAQDALRCCVECERT